MSDLKLSTRDYIPDNAQELGLIKGVAVLSVNVVQDFLANWKNVTVGGNLKPYEDLVNQAVDSAMNDLKNKAIELKADGICSIRLSTPSVSQASAEIIAIGTAWKYS